MASWCSRMRKMQDLLDLLEKKKLIFAKPNKETSTIICTFYWILEPSLLLRPKNNANEDPQHVCVCEHRVTYWVFAKSFSPKKVCLKTFCGCRWFNEWLLPKENDKVCFLATRTQVFFLRKIQMFSLLLVLHSRLFKFFCNNLFPLSLIISYFIISICKNVLKRFIITHLCNDFSWCNYSILHTCELFTKFF